MPTYNVTYPPTTGGSLSASGTGTATTLGLLYTDAHLAEWRNRAAGKADGQKARIRAAGTKCGFELISPHGIIDNIDPAQGFTDFTDVL